MQEYNIRTPNGPAVKVRRRFDPHLLYKYPGSRIEIITMAGETFSLEVQDVRLVQVRPGRPRKGQEYPTEQRLIKLYEGEPVLELRDDWFVMDYAAGYRIVSSDIQESEELLLEEVVSGSRERFVVASCEHVMPKAERSKSGTKPAAKAA